MGSGLIVHDRPVQIGMIVDETMGSVQHRIRLEFVSCRSVAADRVQIVERDVSGLVGALWKCRKRVGVVIWEVPTGSRRWQVDATK